MGNNFNYKSSFDCKETIKNVKKLPSDAWHEFTFRQDNYNPHRDTLTIPLLFNTNFSAEPLESKYFNIFKKDIDILKNIFTSYYGPGKLVRAILVNLPAQKAVPDHYDFGESLERLPGVLGCIWPIFCIDAELNESQHWRAMSNRSRFLTRLSRKAGASIWSAKASSRLCAFRMSAADEADACSGGAEAVGIRRHGR